MAHGVSPKIYIFAVCLLCAHFSLMTEVRRSNYVITWKPLIRCSSVLAGVISQTKSSLFCQGCWLFVSMATSQHAGLTAILGNRKSCTTEDWFNDGEVLKWSGTKCEEQWGYWTKCSRVFSNQVMDNCGSNHVKMKNCSSNHNIYKISVSKITMLSQVCTACRTAASHTHHCTVLGLNLRCLK